MAIFFLANLLANTQIAVAEEFWLELKAPNKMTRNQIVDLGFDIVSVEKDHVVVLASEEELHLAQRKGLLQSSYWAKGVSPYSFPAQDALYHSYDEMTLELQQKAQSNSDIVQMTSLGKTIEQREIWALRLSAAPAGVSVPAALFVGGHHAREHLSVEVPLALVNHLIEQYRLQNPRVVSILNTREIFIVPMLNSDGAEFDIATGKYISWRKNRRPNSDGSYGVDLNRNYDLGWGTTGSSSSGRSDTYMGPSPFSEPETIAFRKFIESHKNISSMVSYHTFGRRILWPWSYDDSDIPNSKDLDVFKKVAQAMAKSTGYIAQKSGDMYLSGGDTCDWAYGVHGIFAFTFELDPLSAYEGGFYPGTSIMSSVQNKNIEPALYLMEISENPYNVL